MSGNYDWHSAYRDVSWAYVKSQAELDRLAQYVRQHFPHVIVPIDDRKSLIDTVIVLLSGLHEPPVQWLHADNRQEELDEELVRSDRRSTGRVSGVQGAGTSHSVEAPAAQAVP